MSKQADMFGMGDVNVIDDDDEGDEYVLVQLIAAEGWRAVFHNPNGPDRVLGLACFALVEIIPDNPEVAQIPQRAVRPMVVDEFGDVEDVATFDDFLCVVPPNTELQPMIDFALKNSADKTTK